MNNDYKEVSKLSSYIEKIEIGRELLSLLTALATVIGLSLVEILSIILFEKKNELLEWLLFGAGPSFITS